MVAPAATVTDAGTVTMALLLVRRIADADAAAGPLKVTVPVDVVPPTMLVGLTTNEFRMGAVKDTVAICELVPYFAVTDTFALLATGVVVALKVAVVFPAAIVTDAGTTTDGAPLDRVTKMPPVGAGPLIVTVPVVPVPPSNVEGEKASVCTAGGLIVRAVFFEIPPAAALMVATT